MSTDDRTPLTTSEALAFRRGAEAMREAIAVVIDNECTPADYWDIRSFALPEPPAAEPGGLRAIYGKWPGDETDEQVAAALSREPQPDHDARIRRVAIEECQARLRDVEWREGGIAHAEDVINDCIAALESLR